MASRMIEILPSLLAAATKPDVVYTAGLGLAGVGRYEEAITVFKRILEVMPEHSSSHKALAMVYRSTNNPRLALEHYHQAARLEPPDESLLADIRQTLRTIA